MIGEILGIITTEMTRLGVPYEFMRWTGALQYPYFVGEYIETPSVSEDGYREYTFLITGTTRNDWLSLETHRSNIENHFSPIGGASITTSSGVVVIFYETSTPVDTGEADLKRLQINLTIKSWKGTY